LTSSKRDNEIIAEDREATRILLVEDHTSFRQALAFLLEAEPEFVVTAQAGTIAEAREAIKGSEEVDIAIVDLALPDGDGVDLIRELSANANVTTLVLSASVDRTEFARAIEAGAAGILHKTDAVKEIANAVRRLRAGEALLSPNEVIEMLRIANHKRQKDHEIEMSFESLTARERQILEALAEGLDSKEIAQKLHITIEIERSHMVNILNKLDAHSRLQALVLAARHGLVEIR
jgi:DNA-binding NarL/FixJ family response regulator